MRLIKGMRKIAPALGAGIKNLVPDALALTGAFCIWRGIDMINRPAGVIAAGILLIAGAVIWSRGDGK